MRNNNKSTKYKLSIITINFNNVDGLKRTVESVINQTWKGFEYIIIDGGSTDGSAEYIEEHKEHFDYWVSEPDNGIYNAMNKGISVASGEYLLFLNSGDVLAENTVLNRIFSSCDKYNASCLFGNCQYGDGPVSYIAEYPEILQFSKFLVGGINHQCVFFEWKLFIKYGLYSEEYKLASDWLFMFKTLLNGEHYKKLDLVVSRVEMGGVSSTSQYDIERKKILIENYNIFIKDFFDFLELRSNVDSIRWVFRRFCFLVKKKLDKIALIAKI